MVAKNFRFNYAIPKSGGPVVTINEYCLAFNSVVVEFLGKPEKVAIGFDEQNHAIGVRPTLPEDDSTLVSTYEFGKKVDEYGWVRVAMKDFLRYVAHGSEVDFLNGAVQFIPEFDEDNKMVIILVDQEHVKGRKKQEENVVESPAQR